MSISKYEFSMLSDPSCLSFHQEDWKEDDKTGTPIRNWNKILFKDSLFDFFPYCETYFIDAGGQIIDSVFFVEGLDLTCKLGFPEEDQKDKDGKATGKKIGGYLEHTYVWSANEINNIKIAQSVSGDNLFMMISKYFKSDVPKSRTFNHEDSTAKKQTISEILKNVILPDWGIPKEKYNNDTADKVLHSISDTAGTPYLNQNNITNKQFICKLAEWAYSQNNAGSGFYTFFNCQGEFYFMTIQAMLDQPEVKEYIIDLNKDMMLDEKYIKDYRVFHGGMPVNFDNYNRKIYRYKPSSVSSNASKNIHNVLSEYDSETQLLIRNQYTTNTTRVSYAGIQDDDNLYNGFVNQFYRDTHMCYRMVIVVDFSPLIVSGKTVKISLQKQTKDNELAKEFDGKWLIVDSIHTMGKDGIPYSQLTISKPQIQVDKTHIFYNDFKAP